MKNVEMIATIAITIIVIDTMQIVCSIVLWFLYDCMLVDLLQESGFPLSLIQSYST